MCNCNKTPNMISVVTKALQRKFPEQNLILEEIITEDINDLNNPRYIGENFASFFFGNLICMDDTNYLSMETDTHQFYNIFKFDNNQTIDRDIIFSCAEALLIEDNEQSEECKFTFYGWHIYVEGSTVGQPDEPLKLFKASSASIDLCVDDATPLYKDVDLYHDGVNTLPDIGDTIYTDSEGTELFVPNDPVTEHFYIGQNPSVNGSDFLKVDENSQRIEIVCK